MNVTNEHINVVISTNKSSGLNTILNIDNIKSIVR